MCVKAEIHHSWKEFQIFLTFDRSSQNVMFTVDYWRFIQIVARLKISDKWSSKHLKAKIVPPSQTCCTWTVLSLNWAWNRRRTVQLSVLQATTFVFKLLIINAWYVAERFIYWKMSLSIHRKKVCNLQSHTFRNFIFCTGTSDGNVFTIFKLEIRSTGFQQSVYWPFRL